MYSFAKSVLLIAVVFSSTVVEGQLRQRPGGSAEVRFIPGNPRAEDPAAILSTEAPTEMLTVSATEEVTTSSEGVEDIVVGLSAAPVAAFRPGLVASMLAGVAAVVVGAVCL